MKALTIRQPWASLIIEAGKDSKQGWFNVELPAEMEALLP